MSRFNKKVVNNILNLEIALPQKTRYVPHTNSSLPRNLK